MRYLLAVVSAALHKLPKSALLTYASMEDCEVIPSVQLIVKQLNLNLKDDNALLEEVYYNHTDIFAYTQLEVERILGISSLVSEDWTKLGRLTVSHYKLPSNYYDQDFNLSQYLTEEMPQRYYDMIAFETVVMNKALIKEWKDSDKLMQRRRLSLARTIIEGDPNDHLFVTKTTYSNILKAWSTRHTDISNFNQLAFWTYWVSQVIEYYQHRLLTATPSSYGVYYENKLQFEQYKNVALNILADSPYAEVLLYQGEHANAQAIYQIILHIPSDTLPYKVVLNTPYTEVSHCDYYSYSSLTQSLPYKLEGIYKEDGMRLPHKGILFTENMVQKRFKQLIGKHYPHAYPLIHEVMA